LKAINYFIIIDKIKEAPKKVGGLEVMEKNNNDIRYLKAEVVSVGEKVEHVKENDIIRYDKHAGHGIEWGGKLYQVITINDVVIVE
jgi:co-chaperonin GroES (HSP10)|tara:strand:- start:203 stop:460 length:258 start_codon:yes stop_codon:yes gene_type:complete